MKNNITKIIAVFFLTVTVFSCVSDDDFDVPEISNGVVEAPGNVVGLNTVISRLVQAGTPTLQFETGRNEYVEAFIISNDEGGNWFKELVIQDKAENPTTGINVQVDVNPLFTTYEFGRKVFIKLDGLTVGTKNGVYTLGIGANLDRIQESLRDSFIVRSNVVATIVPKVVTFSQFSNAIENTWIRLENVQFIAEDLGKTFAAEGSDQFDGERQIKSCASAFGINANFFTSTFSDFKSLRLPEGRGTMDAILSRDFIDSKYVLYVNSPENIKFDNPSRCDVTPAACGLATTASANTIFFENFETSPVNQPAMPAGWVNFQESGTQTWRVFTATGTNPSLGRSVNVGSFRSNDASTVAWLITPRINLDNSTGEVLSFETSSSFADGSTLQVLFSNNWDGTAAGVTSATWQPLTDATIVQDTDPFANWIFSGNIKLDCLTGNSAIAFRYQGSGDAASDGTYELDNVRITRN